MFLEKIVRHLYCDSFLFLHCTILGNVFLFFFFFKGEGRVYGILKLVAYGEVGGKRKGRRGKSKGNRTNKKT